jgi:hypothetical protein
MTFILVQFWGPLPTIHEGLMSDIPPGSLPSGDYPNASQSTRPNVTQISTTGSPSETNAKRPGQGFPQPNFPQNTYAQVQSYPSQNQVSRGRPDSFNLTGLGGALPDTSYQALNSTPQRLPTGHSPSLVYQMQSIPQYGGAQAISPQLANTPYNMPFQGQYQGMYTPSHVQTAPHLQSGNTGSQFFQGQGYIGQPQQANSQFYVQPSHYGPHSQIYSGESPIAPYGMQSGFPGDNRHTQRGNEYGGGGYSAGAQGRTGSMGELNLCLLPLLLALLTKCVASSTGQSSVVRGPPRKPRQSGELVK